jgi:hypothetical protein
MSRRPRAPPARLRFALRLVAIGPKTSSFKEDLLRTPIEFEPRRQDNLFLWTVFLLLLVLFSMACWIGSYLVFSRPELPISYRLLRKIKKIDLPQRFKVNAAPHGEFLSAEKLYARFNALAPSALRDLNLQLERGYLRNYPPAGELVPYVTGRFTILDSYELGADDFVSSGVVALAVSTDTPKLLIEHIYSASPAIAPIIQHNLKTGMDIELRRTFELTAVLHVTKLADGRIQLTVVPLNYGSYVFKGSAGGFTLEPPSALDVAAGWPLIRDERRDDANKAFQLYRSQNGLSMFTANNKAEQKPAETAFKGVDVPIAVPPALPAATATPAAVVAAIPVKEGKAGKKAAAVPVPAAAPKVAAAPVPVARALPVDEPIHRPAAAAPGVLKATSAAALGQSSGVSLQPFFSAPAPATTGNATAAAVNGGPTRSWTLYAAGREPTGKSVHVNEIAALSQQGGLNGQPVYLSGDFVVRAVGVNRAKGIKNAVLRSSADSKVRVIVEYPTNQDLPPEGTELSRDEQRPYQIMDVREGADGTLNVFAREIIAP